jgi:hypothetical protein
MTKIGGILLFFGIGSIVLNYMGMEFQILMWIDNWGLSTGMAIRIGFAVLGAILLILGMVGSKQPVQQDPPTTNE